jgi:hypothetical protein
MIYIIILLVLLLLAAGTLIVFLLRMCDKLSQIVENFEEQVEESLDILDKNYKQMSDILEIPVFYDEPVVKNALNTMGNCREAILLIANKLTTFETENEEE